MLGPHKLCGEGTLPFVVAISVAETLYRFEGSLGRQCQAGYAEPTVSGCT